MMDEAFAPVKERSLFFPLQGACSVHLYQEAKEACLPLSVHRRHLRASSTTPAAKPAQIPSYHTVVWTQQA